MKQYTLAVDAMGSDQAPKTEVEAVLQVVEKFPQVTVKLYGDQEKIAQYLPTPHTRIEVIHCEDVITGNDDAATAVRVKKQSSMAQAIMAVRQKQADAVISSGNTGAYLSGTTLLLGRLKGINRPALASTMPTTTAGKNLIFLDLGAISDGTEVNIVQNAIMGQEMAKILLDVPTPRVALLNNGTETKKGSEIYVQAHKLLADKPAGINFVGNIEPREMFDGHCDVITCEGFAGNITLKSLEGMQKVFTEVLTQEVKQRFAAKIGYLLMKPALRGLKNRLDYRKIGGAMMVGLKAPAIKAHGGSDTEAFTSALSMAVMVVEKELTAAIAEAITATTKEV
ncbi:MAG: phosphate acyltransferase PlsX [Culicoidibacterales bacterium]